MAALHRQLLSHGATLLTADRTRFDLWAPDCKAVTLELVGKPPVPMRREEGGWFRAEGECGAGTGYRYRIRPDLAVPDPASRAQDGDVAGASLVIDPRAYPWRNDQWRGRPWHEAVLYEAHPGVFGGFDGLAKYLPRLAALGVTAVELMPVADFSGQRNWGYDGVLPFAPDAVYGTPYDLKALIDRAHDFGIMMIQDVVYNHFGPEGNYLHSYASAFFRSDIHTPWGVAIDFKNPIVRRFFIENALYWLEEFQFDGLRLDAVHAIPDRDWLLELSDAVVARYLGARHVHLILENDNNDAELLETAFTAQWNDDAHHAAHVLITGETAGYYSDYASAPAAALARCLAEGFAFQGEASAYREGARRGAPSSHLGPDRFVAFLQNHDQVGNRAFGDRLAAIVDPDTLKVGVAMLLLSPQIPMLFMGEECGATEPFLYFTDFTGALADAVRNGRRKEFGRFPEFSHPEAQSRIPDPNALDTFTRSRPDFDRADAWATGWQAFYRDLIALRQAEIVPHLPKMRAVSSEVLGDRALRATWSFGPHDSLTLAMNFGGTAVQYVAPEGRRLFACGAGDASTGTLAGRSMIAIVESGA